MQILNFFFKKERKERRTDVEERANSNLTEKNWQHTGERHRETKRGKLRPPEILGDRERHGDTEREGAN